MAKVKPKRAKRTTNEERSPAPRRNRAVKTTAIQTMTPKVKVNRKVKVRVNPKAKVNPKVKAKVNRNPKVKAKVNLNPKVKVKANPKVKVSRRSLREANGARRAKRRRKARKGNRSCAYLVYNFLKSVKYIYVSSIKKAFCIKHCVVYRMT